MTISSKTSIRLGLAALLILAGLLATVTSPTTTSVQATAQATAGSSTFNGLEVVMKFESSDHPLQDAGGLAVDGQGNLYISEGYNEQKNFRIVKFDSTGKYVTTWGKRGIGPGEFEWSGYAGDVGGIAADKAGNVYVPSGYNFTLEKFDTNGQLLLQWGSRGSGKGQFMPPAVCCVSVDRLGYVYVSNFTSVFKFDSSGNFISRLGSSGSGDGQFRCAEPTPDNRGNIYVSDCNDRVQVFDSTGKLLFKFGSFGNGDGEFDGPNGIIVDSQGHVFVTDHGKRLQVFDGTGKFLAKLTDPGNGDGPFFNIGAPALDSQDNLYLAFTNAAGISTVYKFREK